MEMHGLEIDVSYEDARGCGFRSTASNGVGVYLMGDMETEFCDRLPIPLETCPCCGSGIKPARGFQWMNPIPLLDPGMEPHCKHHTDGRCARAECPFGRPQAFFSNREGLIWIGEKHYATPYDFVKEATKMGVSRKLSAVPDGFEVGVNVIFLGHRKGLLRTEAGKVVYVPAIFGMFKPTRVDLVIDDPDDVPETALRLKKKLGEHGRLVKVIPNKEMKR